MIMQQEQIFTMGSRTLTESSVKLSLVENRPEKNVTNLGPPPIQSRVSLGVPKQ